MDVKPGYKMTEVGVIPEDWDPSQLKDVCIKIQDGTHFSPRLGGNEFLYITSKNIRFGELDLSSVERISKEEHDKIYARCDVRFGDLLLTKDGANTGNAALSTITEPISLLSSVAFLRFDPKKNSAEFHLQAILSKFGQDQITEAMSGNAITRLTLQKIRKLRFPLPSLPEQRAIAAALSDVDTLIAQLDRLIAKKRDLKQAAMQRLLTGNTRLPGFSGEWEEKKLGELTKVVRGASPRPIEDPKWFDANSAIGWVRISDLNGSATYLQNTPQKLSSAGIERSRLVVPGSLIMSIAATLGRPAITANTVCIHDGFVHLGQPVVEILFLFYYLKSIEPNWKKLGQTGSQMNLNTALIKGIRVPVPPTKKEQTAIAQVLSDMDSEITALEARRDKTNALKQGMMKELLTGRIRLV